MMDFVCRPAFDKGQHPEHGAFELHQLTGLYKRFT
jgi:hypothetical protein